MRTRGAFTLLEMLVALAIGLMIALAAFSAVRVASQTMATANRLATENRMMRTGVTLALEELDYWLTFDDPTEVANQGLRPRMDDAAPITDTGRQYWQGLPFTPLRDVPVANEFLEAQCAARGLGVPPPQARWGSRDWRLSGEDANGLPLWNPSVANANTDRLARDREPLQRKEWLQGWGLDQLSGWTDPVTGLVIPPATPAYDRNLDGDAVATRSSTYWASVAYDDAVNDTAPWYRRDQGTSYGLGAYDGPSAVWRLDQDRGFDRRPYQANDPRRWFRGNAKDPAHSDKRHGRYALVTHRKKFPLLGVGSDPRLPMGWGDPVPDDPLGANRSFGLGYRPTGPFGPATESDYGNAAGQLQARTHTWISNQWEQLYDSLGVVGMAEYLPSDTRYAVYGSVVGGSPLDERLDHRFTPPGRGRYNEQQDSTFPPYPEQLSATQAGVFIKLRGSSNGVKTDDNPGPEPYGWDYGGHLPFLTPGTSCFAPNRFEVTHSEVAMLLPRSRYTGLTNNALSNDGWSVSARGIYGGGPRAAAAPTAR